MTVNQQDSCTLCDGTELVWGALLGYQNAVLFKPYQSDRLFRPTLDVDALVCSDCGHMVRFRVKKPEKLKPKKT
jgi:hypothetical protein